MSALVRLYPAAWRARYGPEFEELLADRPPTIRDVVDIVLAAADARLSPQVEPTRIIRRPTVSDQLAGLAAIGGGVTWCLAIVAAGLVGGDVSMPVLIAIGLMLLSLPGGYLINYRRQVGIGVAVVAVSVGALFAQVLPWGPVLLLPALVIFGALGPGALALAAARARIGPRGRWSLLLIAMPVPIAGGLMSATGLADGAGIPLAIASILPLGIAWIATGARIARGPIVSKVAAAGGPA